MTWIVEKVGDDYSKLFHLKYFRSDRPIPEDKYTSKILKYQAWAWGGCSAAQMWGFNSFGPIAATTDVLAEFIKEAVIPVIAMDGWNPHRVFCQVPAGGTYGPHKDYQEENSFFKLLRETIFPDLQPAYVFENKSHASTQQRIFDLNTDVMISWMENYYAEQQKLKDAQAAAATGSGNGTIIVAASTGWKQPDYFADATNGS